MMLGWRSARGRAILAGAVFMVLLAAMALVAVWRAQDDRGHHHSLEQRSEVAAALEHARAEAFRGATSLTAAVFTEDPTPYVESWRQADAKREEELDRARAGLIALGDTSGVGALDRLTAETREVRQEMEGRLTLLTTADVSTRVALAGQSFPELWASAAAPLASLDQLVREQQAKFVAEGAAADSASGNTLALLVGLSVFAFLTGAVVLSSLVMSVVRPLASLRAGVRAIALGNREARAKVAGPDEVASLARDFNEMVSERKRAEEALRESEERARLIVETAYDAFISIDAGGVIMAWNTQAEVAFGWSRSDAIGQRMADLIVPPQYREAQDRGLKHFLATGEGPVLNRRVEMTALHRDGHEFPVELAVWPVRSAETLTFNAFIHDITERKRMEEALREQVRRDPLTGVLNHLAIVGKLRDLMSDGGGGGSHAVAMVDVDGLKATNDTYGHQVGDTVLVTVAGALSRDGAVVGRYGGDEFVALLPGADRDAAERYRQGVLAALAEVELRDPETGARVPVVVSVGLAIYPTEAGRLEELIKLADSEMYAAKRQRPVRPAARCPPQRLGSERAAKMVGEIIPLLTSPGDLNEKLRLVAQCLSVDAGYDGVDFVLVGPRPDAPPARSALARAPDEVIETWTDSQRQATDVPMRRILERTHRPIIVEDPQHDARLTDTQREVLRVAGLRSALVAPMIWRNELIGHLSVASKREAAFGPRDVEFLMAVATQVTAIVRMTALIDELKSASARVSQGQAETVLLLAAAAEAHDRTTGRHLQNVRAIAEALAREVGYSGEDARELGLAAVLHDIGKIRVPDVILASTGRLTASEWELLKQHTVWGEEFLKERAGFELAATIARSHHEHWDGSGYPDGLSGDGIPEAATIVAVADGFDAMISERPYRAARSVAAAVREIVACSSQQFCPRVVEALLRLHKRRMLPCPRQPVPHEEVAA